MYLEYICDLSVYISDWMKRVALPVKVSRFLLNADILTFFFPSSWFFSEISHSLVEKEDFVLSSCAESLGLCLALSRALLSEWGGCVPQRSLDQGLGQIWAHLGIRQTLWVRCDYQHVKLIQHLLVLTQGILRATNLFNITGDCFRASISTDLNFLWKESGVIWFSGGIYCSCWDIWRPTSGLILSRKFPRKVGPHSKELLVHGEPRAGTFSMTHHLTLSLKLLIKGLPWLSGWATCLAGHSHDILTLLLQLEWLKTTPMDYLTVL